MRFFLGIGILLLSLTFEAHANETSSHKCFEQDRIPQVCLKMMLLRSHIELIEEQRDLMRTNFVFLQRVGHSMDQIIAKLMLNRHFDDHLQPLSEIRSLAQLVQKEALAHNVQVFKTANNIRAHCDSCHGSPTSPSTAFNSPPSLEGVFTSDWSMITNHCNKSGQNPYACKQMFAMRSIFSFLETSLIANEFNYELAEVVARELSQLTDDLLSLNGLSHEGGEESLRRVNEAAHDLQNMAANKNPLMFEHSQKVFTSCGSCHKLPQL